MRRCRPTVRQEGAGTAKEPAPRRSRDPAPLHPSGERPARQGNNPE